MTDAPDANEAPATVAASRWRRALRTALHPHLRRVDVAVAVLLGLLGFAAAVQVRSTQDDGLLASARQEDLVQILDDLTSRSLRLRQEITTLTATQERLTTGSGRDEAAVAEARRRAQVLGILAGTVAARGPGVLVTVQDPTGKITPEDLLDALEEMRDAGAEAIQLEGSVDPETNTAGAGQTVRVVAATSFVDAGDRGGVEVDGTLLQPSYRFVVIGDSATIAAALAIPGGVIDHVEQAGGRAVVVRRESVLVGALRPLDRPRYARPADKAGD
ncbi:MAG: DUF881 domain-containing protein [Frankiaceae bacterium]|nr:DUF881 domain-containing protein [Frankiaceae bacterium]